MRRALPPSGQLGFAWLDRPTSSPGSGGGASPCDSPDGPTTGRSGPEAVHASPSASPDGGGGESDERHLWPAWFGLIRECRPAVVFGEQVASRAGLAWLDSVSADLEGEGYAFGASILCAAGVGAPHVRQRIYFAASLGDAERARVRDPGRGPDAGAARGVPGEGLQRQRVRADAGHADDGRASWDAFDRLACNDGQRPVEPGTFPLVDGFPGRVGRLRAYGNAIVPPLAATFVKAFMDCAGI